MSQTWNQTNQGGQNAGQPLSEQELAFDLLYHEKANMSNMASDVIEVSHQGLRQVINDSYMQIGQDQLRLFQIMSGLNWYETKPATTQEIGQAKQKYQQMRNTL